jgi:methionyl-tRNA formyltransferase
MTTVNILCTDPSHPVNPWLEQWAALQSTTVRVDIRRDAKELTGGDFLFLVSCHQIIRKPVRDLFRYTLVLHASALPSGRGMSPHIWQILEGSNDVVVTLLDAEDALDSGMIWQQREIRLSGTELHDEINSRLFAAEIELMTWALDHCDTARPWAQEGAPTYYRKRTPEDSRLDPHRPLTDSFELLRVADPDRYPAFFEYRGRKYVIRLEKFEP